MEFRHMKLRHTKKCANFFGHPVFVNDASSKTFSGVSVTFRQ